MNTEEFVNNRVVIYGLSTETERVLTQWSGKYKVIGLLDSFQSAGEMYGYPILNINDVLQIDDVVIVVIARPGSCKAIAKNIGKLCKEHGVRLIDIRGNDLLIEKKVVYNFKDIRGYTKTDLIARINKADVVSFDLFDTLFIRNVLSVSDVFEILEDRMQDKGIIISDFVSKRIAAEKCLSRTSVPKLIDIYAALLRETGDLGECISTLAKMEFEIDAALIQPREDVVEYISISKKLGKKVYITSDSYYSRSQLQKLLVANGINDVDDIIVSCEYHTDKVRDLFGVLVKKAGTKNILHIGDDLLADVEAARSHGIESFKIYSGAELLDAAGGLNLICDNMSLSDNIKVGMFIANVFNSPFQFEDTQRRLHVDTAEQMGYLFFAPMLVDFVRWFGDQVNKNNVKNIWFCSRDGYLLKKLFDKMFSDIKTEYFLTSRTASIRAGVEDEEDIKFVESMCYSGDVDESVKTRFGIDVKKLPLDQVDFNRSGLFKYGKCILNVAKEKRKNYLEYISKLEIRRGGIAFFDFVAKGTSQMYIQKMVNEHIKGLYFLQLEPEYMKEKKLDIIPFFPENEREGSSIFSDYYILETILTSPEPSVDEFDAEGNVKYAVETRAPKDIKCVMNVQDGIERYMNRFLAICHTNEIHINKKLDEAFLDLIHHVEIRDKGFLELKIEDPFFNRMTDILDCI